MLKVFRTLKDWRYFRSSFRYNVNPISIGLVPTLGCLHEGHCSLIKRSIFENDFSVLSIFVNEAQFSNKSDYENYPRTVREDLAIAEREGVDAVILPTKDEMYPDGFHYKVTEDIVSLVREGKYRPSHFTGELTVVLKLLNLVKPDKIYFGEKDYQQYELMKGMTEAFFIDTKVALCPVVRDENGVPVSSRNRFLSKEQMELAKKFPLLLSSKHLSRQQIISELENLGFKVNYVEEVQGRRYGSVSVGDTVLIDNILVSEL